MRLRVWWIPQIPSDKPFHVKVRDIPQAALIYDTLAEYDAYQIKHHIKPDYANAGGLEVYDCNADGVWVWREWHDDEGRDIAAYVAGD